MGTVYCVDLGRHELFLCQGEVNKDTGIHIWKLLVALLMEYYTPVDLIMEYYGLSFIHLVLLFQVVSFSHGLWFKSTG